MQLFSQLLLVFSIGLRQSGLFIFMTGLHVTIRIYQVVKILLQFLSGLGKVLILLFKPLDFGFHVLSCLRILAGLFQRAIVILVVVFQGFHS